MALATIGGVTVSLNAGASNPAISDAIGQRSTATLQVRDSTGGARYQRGAPVLLFNDVTGELVYGGVVWTDKFSRPAYSNDLIHDIDSPDWHYLADKRIVATSYSGVTCGAMVNDVLANWLGVEGVYAVRNVLSANQSDVETNTTGFVVAGTGTVTLTRDTTTSWHGAASLKVVTDGLAAFQGVRVAIASSGLLAGAQYTASVYLRGSGTVILSANGDTLGNIGTSQTITLSGVWTRYSVAFTLPATISGNIGFTVRTNGTAALTWNMDGMQLEPTPPGNVPDGLGGYAANVSPWELGGTSTVQAGPTLSGSIAFNYKPASAVMDKLAQLAGFAWWIDRYKRLYFQPPATITAPFTFDGTQADLDRPLELELTNPLYRNGQWVLGATEVTSNQTETRKGDGATRSWSFSYPLHQVPSAFTVDAVAKTLGIKGVDSGKDFYWSKGDPVIAQDSAGTLLTSANTISMTYKGEYKVVTFTQDAGEVANEQATEGAGTGLVEDVQTDTSLVTSAQAFQLAQSYLAKYATSGETLRFTTKTPGLRSGQLLTVNMPAPWSISSQQYLIESVRIWYDGVANWWYEVAALSGPVNDTWVQFWTRLASTNSVTDSESSGQQQSVALLQPFTAAWAWAATLNAVVTACPLFPWTFPVTFC